MFPQDEGGVLRLGDRPAVDQHDHVAPDPQRRLGPGVDQRRAVRELERGPGADRAAGGEAEVADHDVGAGLRHRRRVVLAEHVGRGQQVLGAGLGDHVDLEAVAHAGLLEVRPEDAVDQADRREVLHAGEAHRLQLVEEDVHEAERVGAVDAGEHRRAPDHRQHLGRHLDHDRVGVAVGEQAGERAAAGHAVAAGVVDDDEVDAARLLALGREPGAGAAADDRLAARDHAAELLQESGALEAHRYLAPARAAARRPPCSARKALDGGGGEGGVVDVGRQPDELARAVWRTVRSSAANSAASAAGSWKALAGRVERRDAALGQEKADRRVHPVQPLADPVAHTLVLLRRRAHQRDLRVVLVEAAAAVSLRHRLGRRRN